jgi:hypothetical protein
MIYSYALDSNNIFIETNKGVYYSGDFGNLWQQGTSIVPFNSKTCVISSKGEVHYFNENGRFSRNEFGDWSFTKYITKQISESVKSCELGDYGRLLLQSGEILYLTDIEGRNWKNIFHNGYWGPGRMDMDIYKITKTGLLYGSASYQEIWNDPRTWDLWIIRYRYINSYENSVENASWKRDYYNSDAAKYFYILPNGYRYMLSGINFYYCNNSDNIWKIADNLPIANNAISGFNHDQLNNLYLLDRTGDLFISSDGGSSWRKANNRFPYAGVIELKSFSRNELFVLTSSSIYYSYDCGDSWIDISLGLSGNAVNLFKNTQNEYYLVCSDGLYKSNGLPVYKISEKTTLVKPKNNELINGTIESVRLVWNRTDKADSYEIMTGNRDFEKVFDFNKGIKDTTKTVFARNDTVYWKVRAVANDVPGEWSDTWRYALASTNGVEKDKMLPTEFMLYQNYPNPFNPETKIYYYIPENCFVKMEIYDMLGRLVSVPVNEFKEAGTYFVMWAPKNTSSGIYFLKFNAGSYNAMKKLIFVK